MKKVTFTSEGIDPMVTRVSDPTLDGPTVGQSLDRLYEQESELARLRAMLTWQPIETAPKNRTIWLGTSSCFRAGYWDECDSRWIDYHRAENREPNKSLQFTPTHWMPLPEQPR